jgi:hypothetical protein
MIRIVVLCLVVAGLVLRAPAAAAGQSDSVEVPAPGVSFVVGPLIGVPSGIALLGGIVAAPLSVKVSGGYWGSDWNGVQADIGWVFDADGLLTQGCFLVAGAFRFDPLLPGDQGTMKKSIRQDRYVGLAYEVNYAGFYLQAGLAKGRGDYPNPEALLQAGYLISFP